MSTRSYTELRPLVAKRDADFDPMDPFGLDAQDRRLRALEEAANDAQVAAKAARDHLDACRVARSDSLTAAAERAYLGATAVWAELQSEACNALHTYQAEVHRLRHVELPHTHQMLLTYAADFRRQAVAARNEITNHPGQYGLNTSKEEVR